MDVARPSEKSADFQQIAGRYIPKSAHFILGSINAVAFVLLIALYNYKCRPFI